MPDDTWQQRLQRRLYALTAGIEWGDDWPQKDENLTAAVEAVLDGLCVDAEAAAQFMKRAKLVPTSDTQRTRFHRTGNCCPCADNEHYIAQVATELAVRTQEAVRAR